MYSKIITGVNKLIEKNTSERVFKKVRTWCGTRAWIKVPYANGTN